MFGKPKETENSFIKYLTRDDLSDEILGKSAKLRDTVFSLRKKHGFQNYKTGTVGSSSVVGNYKLSGTFDLESWNIILNITDGKSADNLVKSYSAGSFAQIENNDGSIDGEYEITLKTNTIYEAKAYASFIYGFFGNNFAKTGYKFGVISEGSNKKLVFADDTHGKLVLTDNLKLTLK